MASLSKWMESRRESGGKPLKSPKIGFGEFRMEGGAKKHLTLAIGDWRFGPSKLLVKSGQD